MQRFGQSALQQYKGYLHSLFCSCAIQTRMSVPCGPVLTVPTPVTTSPVGSSASAPQATSYKTCTPALTQMSVLVLHMPVIERLGPAVKTLWDRMCVHVQTDT